MIEIIVESNNAGRRQEISGLEANYLRSVLGAAFRHYGSEIRRAEIRFDSRDGDCHCRIEVELDANVIALDATEANCKSAFARASESLERRLFSAICTRAERRDAGISPNRLAA